MRPQLWHRRRWGEPVWLQPPPCVPVKAACERRDLTPQHPAAHMQVIFAMPPNGAGGQVDLAMRMYNSDGTEPEMCGNGIRCLARFVADRDGRTAAAFRVHTLAGVPRVLASAACMHLHACHCHTTA